MTHPVTEGRATETKADDSSPRGPKNHASKTFGGEVEPHALEDDWRDTNTLIGTESIEGKSETGNDILAGASADEGGPQFENSGKNQSKTEELAASGGGEDKGKYAVPSSSHGPAHKGGQPVWVIESSESDAE